MEIINMFYVGVGVLVSVNVMDKIMMKYFL